MTKSNSLTNRILALALTVVMLLGMMPSGALAADATVTVRFDNSETQWEVVCCLYEDADSNLISAGDAGGECVWQIPADSKSVRFQNYLPGTPEDAAPAEGFLGTELLPVVDGGTYTYTPADTEPEVTYVAEVNGTKYATLAEAVAAAESGATVTLLGNASGAGVVIDKDITIDFAGYTYTLTEGVGSANTPTNGLQILSGNDVVLKNGTLEVAEADKNEFYILVQNYADSLTVTNMTLDGTNLDKYSGTDGDSYTLSNNSGNVTVNGNTNIIANDEGSLAYAFDVCQYGSYAVPTVTVNTTGKITGNVQVSEGLEENLTIENGTFTDTSVAPYVVEDKKLDASGVVVAKDYIAEVGGKKYETLAEAVAAAEPGATVTLLGNASGAGVVVNKDITIDFGSYTYTLTEGVGSSGTPTNGLQILSGSDVTLKNGTLAVAEANKNDFYILVQNYADSLTVTDMTLDGTNLDKYSSTDGDSYALSNNSGTVTIGGNTNIIANDEGDKAYAFDVCQFGGYAAPTVNVETSGTITGPIEVSEGLEENLNISSGTYTVDVSEYCVSGKTAEQVGGQYIVKQAQNFAFESAEYTVDYKAGLVIEANDNTLTKQGSNDVVYSIAAAEGTKAENATIDAATGEVTVNGVGSFVITAKQEDDGTYASAEASYTLTVNKGASSITLNDGAAVEVTFGQTSYQYENITFVGDGAVSYAITENENKVNAAINEGNGLIDISNTVDQMGTFTVTVTMAEGDNYNATSATYTVTLSYAETPAVPYTLSAEANDKGWYNVESLIVKPADGYQICLKDDLANGEWSANGIAFANGVHTDVTVYLKDAQGNITESIVVGTLQVDNVVPTAGIEIVSDVWNVIVGQIFFVTNEDITLKITAGDVTSGIESVQLSYNSGESFEVLGAENEYTVALSAEYRDLVQVKVIDKAGHEYVVDSEHTFVVDRTAPKIGAAFIGTDAESKDKNGNTVYFDNGVDFSVKYTVDENNLDLHNKDLAVSINGDAQDGWTLSDDGVVEKPLTGEGVYEITAVFTDVANNEPAAVTNTYVIDTVAPTITLDPGEAKDINGVYYTAATGYGVGITVNEALYDTYLAHGVVPEVTVKRNGADYNHGALDWEVNAVTLNLNENGVYVITVSYDNLVHDKVTETITVCVDHEVPEITLTPDIDKLVDGIYYTSKENYGLKISLDEDLYDHYLACGFKPVVTVNDKDAELDWNEPETTLTLADNGVYTVVVNYQNHLHQAEQKTITICVDHEVPEITLTPGIELVKNDVYYTSAENYGLKISLNEDLYDHYLACGFKPVVTVNGVEKTDLDWSKPETTLTLAENGVHEVVVNYENRLHKAEQKTITVCVDHEVPEITLTPGIELVENNVYYTSAENYGLNISLNEDLYAHYLSCGIKPVVTVNDKEAELDWSKPETTLTLAENGVYEVVVSYENYLHKAEEKTITICVDHEVPVIELLHGIEDPDLLVDGIYYTDDEDYTLKITLTEDLYDHYLTCGIAPVVTVNGDAAELTWTASEADPAVLEATLPLTADGEYKIAANYANYLHTAEEKTITIYKDTVDPEVSISYRDAQGNAIEPYAENLVKESVFNQAVTAVITVKDVKFDQNSVKLTVTPANAVATVGAYTASWTEVSEDVWECALVLDVAADYDIAFECQDYANNSNSASADLAVDIAEMPDNFQFGYSTSVHGEILENITLGFWQSQLTVTVDVVDDISGIHHFEAAYSVAEDAYKAGNAEGVFESSELEVLVSEEITNGYRVTFLVPKEILNKDNQVNGYITVTAWDWADNSTTVTDGVRVIADNVNPAGNVNVTAPVNQTETVKYYNGNIVLNASIFEANYRFYNDAVVSITKDGAAYGLAGHTTGWYKGEANATNTITLTEDGDYVVTITYTDGSGNAMNTYSSGKLTLDTVAPVITVTNIEQNSANKDETYGFTITVNDINLDAETVKPVLTAVVQGENGLYSTKQIDLGTAQVSEDGDTVTFTVENLDEDALYTLTCSAEDMSDNLCSEIVLADGKAYETVNFSINRNGSTYGFGSDYMTDLVNQYYVYSVYEDLVIVEVNVDPIEDYTVTINGQELVEGTDFTTEQTSNDGEWSKRTYVVKKELFAEEGEYNVIVSSTDKAETTAYSDIKDLAITFVVDQTAPVLTISGLQTGGRYQTEEQTVTLIPTDEGGRLNSLKVVVMDSDGEPLTDESGNDISVRFEYSGDELLDYLSENGDMVTFTIPSGLEHQVQIVCNDCAVNAEGLTNEYNETFDRVTVSQNALIIFYANKPAFYGTLAGLAALIILIIVLVKKKKSSKK